MKKEFHASLVFRKNEGDLHEMASNTGLEILRIWGKGDILPSRKKAEISYCVCDLEDDNFSDFEEFLSDVAEKLLKNKSEINDFLKSGGEVQIFVTLDQFRGAIIQWKTLKALGSLGVSLGLDRLVYDE